ncbi:hypothetical protein EMCRGX_G029246 [Ephydatia muelleri]
MWHNHMSLHASVALPGHVPSEWLLDQTLLTEADQPSTHHQSPIALEPQTNLNLPTFEQVCQLHHSTLRFVPTKARPAFARALSSALKDVLLHNSEEAWLKLFMLPKCVLPSLKQKGVINPHIPTESLCKMWLKNEPGTLWTMAVSRANNHSSFKTLVTSSTHSQGISSAVSLGRSGMMGKACNILLSSGIAPPNTATVNLLQSKHPSCPPPMILYIPSNPATLSPSFDILHIVRSFPKGTSAGPSGLCIEHLLDAASVPLNTPFCASCKGLLTS